MGKRWTMQELEFLRDHWGSTSVKCLARSLGRTENAIFVKVQRMNLGAFLNAGDYVTLGQLYIALGLSRTGTYRQISWIQNRGFPVKYKTVNNCKFQIVKLADF